MAIEKSLYQAPIGLGQLAGEEPDIEIEVEDPEALHGEEFSKSIDSIMAGMPQEEEPSETQMAMGGMATDQTQFQAPPPAGTMNDQQFMPNLSPYVSASDTAPKMAKGGLMAKKKM
jgi:hypothetical protein